MVLQHARRLSRVRGRQPRDIKYMCESASRRVPVRVQLLGLGCQAKTAETLVLAHDTSVQCAPRGPLVDVYTSRDQDDFTHGTVSLDSF